MQSSFVCAADADTVVEVGADRRVARDDTAGMCDEMKLEITRETPA